MKFNILNFGFLSSFMCLLLITFFIPTNSNEFLDCFSHTISANLSNIVFTPNDTSYFTVLQSTIQNLRFDTPKTPKPSAIITPFSYSHVQTTIICSVKSGLNIRIRSGGHDYEGLSYTSFHHTPFILLDLNQLRSVTVDPDTNTAWVESGATIGELAYWIAKKSNLHGFPMGECTSVGVGGQISGGGYGTMARKYGLSSDNVIDAVVVDVNGRILDKDSMGDDLFWAIRGGGGASFGVVLSWKINLVHVPKIVTVFSVTKSLNQHGTAIVNKWQHIAHNITKDLFINLLITPVQQGKNRTMQVTINAMFLGKCNELMNTISDQFSELGLHEKDCMEMSWIESVVYYSGYVRGQSIEVLIERQPWSKGYFKIKSDYVKKPIPEEALAKIWKWCLHENLILAIEPHGGKMSEIDETATPYPHRGGNLYIIQYMMRWNNASEIEKHVDSIRRVYEKMSEYVSKNPRESYVNFRDLDLGTNCNARSTSYEDALKWGRRYFKDNFKKLSVVKGVVDPTNFFWHEQSVPLPVLHRSY